MADREIEISLRIEFYRDIEDPHAPTGTDYVGAATRDGEFKALCVPRVGEYVLSFGKWMPFPFSPVMAVEHRLRGEGPDGGGDGDRPPSVVVVLHVEWPGDRLRDRVVQDFQAKGWDWLGRDEVQAMLDEDAEDP